MKTDTAYRLFRTEQERVGNRYDLFYVPERTGRPSLSYSDKTGRLKADFSADKEIAFAYSSAGTPELIVAAVTDEGTRKTPAYAGLPDGFKAIISDYETGRAGYAKRRDCYER